MLDFFKKQIDAAPELREEIRILKEENKRLEDQRDGLQNLIDKINKSNTASEPVIDFDTMRVFSIERNAKDNLPVTILGHFLAEPVLSSDGEMIVSKDIIREWYLYINDERHNELVEKFKAWKGKK